MPLRSVALFASLLLPLSAAGEPSDHCSNTVEAITPSDGRQLLQVRRSDVSQKTLVKCFLGIGKDVPLDADGFQEVAQSCCYDDMKDYIRRISESLDMQVCDEGGLSGFAPHFSCSNDTSFIDLKAEMQRAPEAKCPWLGLSHQQCRPIDSSCGVTMNPLNRPSLLKGYLGIDAESNPPALVRNSAVKDKLKSLIAGKLGVPAEAVAVTIGTGPVGLFSLFQLSMKSPRTGKYVQTGEDGHLVANSTSLKTFGARHEKWNDGFKLGGISTKENFLIEGGGSEEVFVIWNEDYLNFQTEAGEHVVEDEHGRVILSRNAGDRLQIDFPGTSLLATGSFEKSTRSSAVAQRSCTVVVSYEVLQTDPPTIDEEQIAEKATTLDVVELESVIDHDVSEIEPCLGHLEISAFKYCREKGTCEDKSLKPAHTDHDYVHVTNATNGSNDSAGGNASEAVELLVSNTTSSNESLGNANLDTTSSNTTSSSNNTSSLNLLGLSNTTSSNNTTTLTDGGNESESFGNASEDLHAVFCHEC